MSRLTPRMTSPPTTAAREHAPLRTAAFSQRAQPDPQEEWRRLELRDRDHHHGDAARYLGPTGGSGQRRQQQGAVGERIPGVEVAEQDRDRERQDQRRDRDRADRHRQDGASVDRRQPPGHQAEAQRRPDRPEHQHDAVGQPGEQRHRLRDRGRIRVEQLHRVRRGAAEHRGVVGALSGEHAPSRVEEEREVEPGPRRRALPQRPADPGDPGPRHDARDHPRAEAVGAQAPVVAGRRPDRCGRHGAHDTRSRRPPATGRAAARVANSYPAG